MKRTPEAAREVHRKRHAKLHAYFDELLADYLAHHRDKLPSTTSLMELMEWSSKQTERPDSRQAPNSARKSPMALKRAASARNSSFTS